ncbi:MAG: type II secretion system F family protein [Candidatus Omnitrophica bacterium]|nr:type II secretion system F family protein [Candidatus Omnitrophota bacterium]MBU4488223.1 type II secretion system F family protein [Candidatus Omnitrophota bacterium]MCG2705498.1 type II secretion system F family protein [Candidatus Omnitrophota bacterium]
MPKFTYVAKKGPKEEVKGVIEAENKNAALHRLTTMGYFPISIEQEDINRPTSFVGTIPGFKRVNIHDLSIFTRQLADLLEAGLPLVKSLTVLEKQTENRYLKSVIADLRNFVQDGNTLSASLKRHPKVFPEIYVSMVRSGEVGGSMENVLMRIAEFQESQEELTSKVKSAMVYPALMASVGVVTILVLITFVIPRIVTMFKDLNQSLPTPTVILLNISNFIRDFWFILLGAILLAYLAFKRLAAIHDGKMAMDRFKLGVPVLGQLILKTEIARFTKTLATLLSNGVPILDALGVVMNIMENEILKEDIKIAQKEVREGSALAVGLAKGAYFPVFVNNMISVGEESGAVEKALFKVASAYEREVDRAVKTMTSLLEPLMILTLGLIIGFIVIAMLLPIFEISFVVR